MSFVPQMVQAENQTNQNAWTREFSEKQYEENMAFQREQYEYAKGLQAQQWNREDTAIQRQVADARAAGVSPLANMQGSSSSLGSASVGGVAGQAPVLTAPSYGNPFADLMQGISAIQDIKGKKLSNEASQLGVDFQRANNKFALAQNLYKTISDSTVLENLMRDNEFKQYYGITDSMEKEQKIWQVIKRELFSKQTSYTEGRQNFYVPGHGDTPYNFNSFDFDFDKVSADDVKKGLKNLLGGTAKTFNLDMNNPLFSFLLSLL